jgi:hypothetical protein
MSRVGKQGNGEQFSLNVNVMWFTEYIRYDSFKHEQTICMYYHCTLWNRCLDHCVTHRDQCDVVPLHLSLSIDPIVLFRIAPCGIDVLIVV